MATRRGFESNLAGARLPIAPDPEPSSVPCDRDALHLGGIAFELHRYGRKVGRIRLCGVCYQLLNPPLNPDPLTVGQAS